MIVSSDLGYLCLGTVLSIELLNTTCGINDLLLASVERMAGRTNFDVKRLFHCRLSLEYATARAGNFDFAVSGMDIGFHVEKFL